MKLFNRKCFSSFNSHLSFQKGFTLIELLIVIAILGILAAAVLVAINPGQRIASARNARVRSDLANIGNAANIFNTDTGLVSTCLSGGSYPNAFGSTGCTITFMAAPIPPTGTYALTAQDVGGGACNPDTSGDPCTRISVSGPSYADGVVLNADGNDVWCWRSATGTITQVASAAVCTP